MAVGQFASGSKLATATGVTVAPAPAFLQASIGFGTSAAFLANIVKTTSDGKYTITLTTALADTNYSVIATSHNISGNPYNIACEGDVTRTTTVFSVETWETSTLGAADPAYVNVAIFGN